MTGEAGQTSLDPVFSSIEAQLYVADMERSFTFYTDKLGFTVQFVYGDPLFYGQVRRDQARLNLRLNLRLVCEPVFAGDIRKREGLLSASITVASAGEIRELFRTYQAAGIAFDQALQRERWGAWTFVVSDPDENRLLFAGPDDGSADSSGVVNDALR